VGFSDLRVRLLSLPDSAAKHNAALDTLMHFNAATATASSLRQLQQAACEWHFMFFTSIFLLTILHNLPRRLTLAAFQQVLIYIYRVQHKKVSS